MVRGERLRSGHDPLAGAHGIANEGGVLDTLVRSVLTVVKRAEPEGVRCDRRVTVVHGREEVQAARRAHGALAAAPVRPRRRLRLQQLHTRRRQHARQLRRGAALAQVRV